MERAGMQNKGRRDEEKYIRNRSQMTSARKRGEGGGVNEKLTKVDMGGGGGVPYKVDIHHDTPKG